MKKLILAIIVLSIGYFTMVKAEETVTPKEFVEAVVSVPGKVGNHVQTEWAEIKSHQAKSWAEMKFKFQALKEKFQPE